MVQRFIRPISAVFWTNSLFFQQVKRFSGMRSALRNAGRPFLYCNEMSQLMFSLQGRYFTTSRGIVFPPLFLPLPRVPVPNKRCVWCTEPLLFHSCRRSRNVEPEKNNCGWTLLLSAHVASKHLKIPNLSSLRWIFRWQKCRFLPDLSSKGTVLQKEITTFLVFL